MSPVKRLVLIACSIVAVGCSSPENGEGFVEGRFAISECRPTGDFEKQDYRFDAGFLGTRRFKDTLTLNILEYAIELEETDGLLVRIDEVSELREIEERPFSKVISQSSTDINVTLSLFQTCPDRPTLVATSGIIIFDEFKVSELPEDTGIEEIVAGTLTATVVGVDGETFAGVIRSEFNYRPGRLAITEPR